MQKYLVKNPGIAFTFTFRIKYTRVLKYKVRFFINLRYEEARFYQHPIHPTGERFFQDAVLKSRR